MAKLVVSEKKLNKVLNDVKDLIEDVADLVDRDKIAKKRLAEIKSNPSIGKSEKELDGYLKKRGVRVG